MNRKFGKRGGKSGGSFGDGRGHGKQIKKGYLPEELLSHYRRVLESLRQFENEDDVAQLDHSKGEFLNNVVSSLAEELIQVSQNQTVSTIVETIIAAASPANLRMLFVSAATDLSVTFLDRFACHVMQTLVLRLAEFFEPPTYSSPDEEEEDVAQDKVAESFESVCEFVDSNFETLVTHAYGSHVLRGLLEALGGVCVDQELKKSQKSGYHGSHFRKDFPQLTQKRKPPETFKALFDKYSKRVFQVCDYEVHLKDPLFSLLLQAVLMILHEVDPKLCQTHCQTILQNIAPSSSASEDPMESIPDMAQDAAGSHLLEVIFKLSGDDLKRQAFDSLLRGKLLYYGIHPTGNHVLQKFIAAVHDRELMEQIYEELSKHLEDVLAVGYFGLVTSLAEGCRRLQVKQDELITKLMEAFHCKEPQERQKSLMKLIASFTAYEVFFSLKEGTDEPTEGAEAPSLKGRINMHGSRLIQELLQFQKPKHAALGLLDWQPAELRMLCCDPAGSHVVDAYFSSGTVMEKNRDILLRKLKGLLLEVACSKNGSRCLESVWKHLNITQRTAVAKELSESERLRSDRFGHFLHRSFQLGLFATKRKRWQEQQGSMAKRKRMVKDLLHKTVSEPPAKKKKTEKADYSIQEEDHIKDSITTLFLKQKKQHDAKHPLSTIPEAHSDGKEEDENENLSPSSSPTPLTPEKKSPSKKKKKRKDKSMPAKASSVELKKKDKVKVVTASSVKLKKTDKVETAPLPIRLKKKDRAKVATASAVKLSKCDESEVNIVKKAKKMKKRLEKDATDSVEKVKKKKKGKKSEDKNDE